MVGNAPTTKPLLFISHKHEDRLLADALRNFVEINTGGAVEVFQSSSDQSRGPRAGFSLNQELKSALWRAGAFVLIYTHPAFDWSYCMFEYGVANSPTSPDTRIVLFRCCEASPALFAGQVSVNARELGDVQKFTNQLLTDPTFFPDYGGPITRHQANNQSVASAAADFYQKLQLILPPPNASDREEWPAYPFIRLQLKASHVDAIKSASPSDRQRKAAEIIQNEAIITEHDKEVEGIFNSPGFDKRMRFANLVSLWKEHDDKGGSQSLWVDSVCKQITEGARWRFPPVIWELMQGIGTDIWYAPILTRVHRVPDQYMDFDIYFFKFEVDEDGHRVRVGVPPRLGAPG